MSDAYLEPLTTTDGDSRYSKQSLTLSRQPITPEKQQALKEELEKPSKVSSGLTVYLKKVRRRLRVWKRCYFSFVAGVVAERNWVWVGFGVHGIEFVQMLAMCFHEIDWGPSGNMFGSALRYSLIADPIVERYGLYASQILVGVYLFIVATLALLIAYVLHSYRYNEFNTGLWVARILRLRLHVIDTVLFIPILYSFFSVYTCKGRECPSIPIQLTLSILCAFALICHITITYVLSFSVFQPNPKSGDPEARTEVMVKVLNTTVRAVIVTVIVFARNVNVLKAVVSYYIALILASMVQANPAQDDMIQNYLFYAYICGIPFALTGSFFGFQARYNHATSLKTAMENFGVKDSSKFNTWDTDVEVDKKKETRFWHPSQVEIATRFLLVKADSTDVDIAEQMFLTGVQTFPDNQWLMLQYATFFLVFKVEKSMALNYITKAKSKGLSFSLEVLAYLQRQDTRTIGNNTIGNKQLETIDRVEFKQLMKTVKPLPLHTQRSP
ncbi:hypothetical protein HDU67_007031 [Dinochytrium kinnereticum]|nr:hypothetical protein HDU67_007031 [Dinochytrium kinnereticum]